MQDNQIKLAVDSLKSGLTVAFPTETVYGLGADASNPEAIKKVFAIKGRPTNHPVIVHIAEASMLEQWAQNIPDTAYMLAEAFWPGPLTLILQKQPHVSSLITGGQSTIGLRIPNHKVTLNLLTEFNGAIVGPSANKYGMVSPTKAAHVRQDLGDEVSIILDGDDCVVGIESTIVDLSGETPILRRLGEITSEQIEEILKTSILVDTHKPGAPGTTLRHYSPKTPVVLVDSKKLADIPENAAILSFLPEPDLLPNSTSWLQASKYPKQYAHDLYANLRSMDMLGKPVIVVELPPAAPEWLAIVDRLKRASAK